MFARIVAKCMTKGGIGAFAPTVIITMNFVTRIKMAIANFAAQNLNAMEEHEDYTKIPLTDNDGHPDRSGCAAIAAALGFIALFWIIVGAILLFT